MTEPAPVETSAGSTWPTSRKHAALRRLALAAVSAALAVWWVDARCDLRLAAGWLTGSLVLLGLLWRVIWSSNAAESHRRANQNDLGRTAILVFLLVASAFSLLAATQVVGYAATLKPSVLRGLWTGVGLASVATSWLLTHTLYALHYAHLYYARRRDGGPPGGLGFPAMDDGHSPAPSDLDFAYFSFTLGICFQTSDVSVQRTRLRRTVLFHALISFGFNTVILGLVVSVLQSLLAGR